MASRKIAVLNGPNLNLLGRREREVYGDSSLEELETYTHQKLAEHQLSVSTNWFQCNGEGDLLDKIQGSEDYDGLVLNPGALSHCSYALYDCLRAISRPVIEVHLSNTHAREFFRSHRLSAQSCQGVIEGLGKDVYYLGIVSLWTLLSP